MRRTATLRTDLRTALEDRMEYRRNGLHVVLATSGLLTSDWSVQWHC